MTGNDNHVKMMILGSGPAGFSAALYAARAELRLFARSRGMKSTARVKSCYATPPPREAGSAIS